MELVLGFIVTIIILVLFWKVIQQPAQYLYRNRCQALIPLEKYYVTHAKKEFDIVLDLEIHEPDTPTNILVMKDITQNIELWLHLEKYGTLYTGTFKFYNPDLKMTAKWETIPTRSVTVGIHQRNNDLVLRLNGRNYAKSNAPLMHKGLSEGHILLNPSNRPEITVNIFMCA